MQKIDNIELLPKCEDYRFTSPKELLSGEIYQRPVEENLYTKENGVVVASFAEFAHRHSDIYNSHYSKLSKKLYLKEPITSQFLQKNNLYGGVVAYSDATHSGGKVIYIPRGESFVGSVEASTRLLIIAEDNTSVDITLEYSTPSDMVQNNVAEIFISRGAKVVTSQSVKGCGGAIFNTILVDVDSDGVYKNVVLSLDSKHVRNNVVVDLNQRGAQAHLYGVSVSSDSQINDHYTLINHNSPNCTSDELYKNIVSDSAIASFQGNIYVKNGADGTDAKQLNRNLILGSGAKAYGKPHLEIYAEDVKCTHASTTGQMDQEALFYMMQRGISPKMAAKLQIQGFAKDVIEKIDNISTKEIFDKYIEEIL